MQLHHSQLIVQVVQEVQEVPTLREYHAYPPLLGVLWVQVTQEDLGVQQIRQCQVVHGIQEFLVSRSFQVILVVPCLQEAQ